LNAVAVPQGRNIQAGTVILKYINVRNDMLRNILIITVCLAFGAGLACSSTPDANSANAPTNLPEGFSTNQITPGGTPTPGIPDPSNIDVNNPPKGATPTPGIPDPKDAGKPLPKGATPTPGIPSEEELRKMANTPRSLDEVNNPKGAANSQKSDGEKPVNPRKQPQPPSQK
jgi:hypothetical protein